MLTLIVPVHNGGQALERCLHAIMAGTKQPDELLVVDDASTDDSVAIAQRYGARVIPLLGKPRGPANARNRGVACSSGDLIAFIDADVAVHPTTVACLEARLLQEPTLVGIFGSYDDAPAAPGLVSQYKNLQHHWVHQHAHKQAQTFWAGCGAIRRAAFAAVGGYDVRFGRPSIEDIELGIRLHDAGMHIALDATILCTHLKHWTLASMWRADILGRAAPWSRLIAVRGQVPRDLNLDIAGRLSGALTWLAVILCCLALFWHPALGAALLAVGGVLWLNRAFYRFLYRRQGWRLLLVGIVLHLGYFIYATAVFAWIALPRLAWRRLAQRRLSKTKRAQP